MFLSNSVVTFQETFSDWMEVFIAYYKAFVMLYDHTSLTVKYYTEDVLHSKFKCLMDVND